ncbi:MAG: type IV pilus assembly protein PilM [Candidatus Omnitrophica bacterium]|nr:type IV pilus assembly protein PilM [Candidatus Omnitrophota bacterium]
MNIGEILGKLGQKGQKRTALGLDIGSTAVKLVELEQDGETVKLLKFDAAKIPVSSSAAEGEQSQITKRITANLLAQNQIKDKDVVVSVNGQSTFIKFLELLPVSVEKLHQTLKYEAQQQIPFSLDEVEWDSHLFKASSSQKLPRQKALLFAIKKDKLTGKMALVEGLGLRAAVLDVSSSSIYNCLKFNQQYTQDKFSVVLNIGAQSTDLIILKGNDFWMRSFSVGGNNFTESLVKKFNINFAEAEKLKHGHSTSSPEFQEAIAAVLEDLQGEITRSIEYYNFQQKSTQEQQDEVSSAVKLDEILISGGGAELAGLDTFLARVFSCAVKQLDPFQLLHLDEAMKAKSSIQERTIFCQAVGLALRGLARSSISINLLKEQIRLKQLARERLLYGIASVVLSLLILFGASTFMRRDYRENNLRLQNLRSLLKTFSSYQPQIQQLQKEQRLVSEKVKAVESVALNRALWLEALFELKKMLPDGLWITELSGTIAFDNFGKNLQTKLDLQGKAASYDGVNDFVSRLKSSNLFSEVKPISSSFIEEEAQDQERIEVVKFSINMKINPR